MNEKINKAKQLFANNVNCAQSTLAVHASDYGISEELAFKLASAMGGGMGHQGKTCGAILGAYLVLGLEFGNQIPNDLDSKIMLRKASNLFLEKFNKKHGNTDCPLLLKKDFRIAEELEEIQETGLTKKLCPNFIQSSIEIIQEVKEELKEVTINMSITNDIK